jgi:hypothetical protein
VEVKKEEKQNERGAKETKIEREWNTDCDRSKYWKTFQENFLSHTILPQR